jgi:hypothetical protein
MPILLLGLAILVLLLIAAKPFAAANPKQLSKQAPRILLGSAALLAALFLATRGAEILAVPVALVGLVLLGLSLFGKHGMQGEKRTARVRSAFVEIELDRRTGAVRGRILADPHYGTSLDAMPVQKLATFLPNIDEESRALMIAYLDRREPRWREHAQADPAAGRSAAASSAEMAPEEAYQILGIEPGASADEIGRAHDALMQKLHPDQGGSTYLAARVNEAKEILLRRHR